MGIWIKQKEQWKISARGEQQQCVHVVWGGIKYNAPAV